MLSADLSITGLAARARRGSVPQAAAPDWPADTVALWLVFGQSNAEGYAPYEQDPARTNPANATPALTAAENVAHDWLRFSTRGSGATAGRFESQGLATSTTPRTSSKVWGETHGIPASTKSFGPEIGLVRHVLAGGQATNWRDDADPRLFVLKQVEGSRTVDHFRWGGAGQDMILTALRQASGTTLSSLQAAKTVLIQGAIFVIGEADATTDLPGGGTSTVGTFDERFIEWIRQVRGMMGADFPIALVEIYDAVDADKQMANQKLADIAAALPNVTVIQAGPGWTHMGDNVHYDAATQGEIGEAAFAHFRSLGRAGDGLVQTYPFTGLKPTFLLPPVFTDDGGGRMKIANTVSESGVIHVMVLDQGSSAPTAAQIVAGDAGVPGFFSSFTKGVSQDTFLDWWTVSASFAANTTQDAYFVLETPGGDRSEVVMAQRAGNVKFAPDLAFVSSAGGAAQASVRPSFTGDLHWVLHEGDKDIIRPIDVQNAAFHPAQMGQISVTANVTVQIDLTGLTPGTVYTLIVTGWKLSTGQYSVTQAITFTAA